MWTRCFVKMDAGRYARKREEAHIPGTHEAPSEEMVRQAWERICREYDEGTSLVDGKTTYMWEVEANDAVTGDRCQMHFVNWQAQVMKYDERYNLVPAGSIDKVGNVSATFTVTSGRVLFTDFLRIESFNKGTEFDSEREYGELSLGNEQGRRKLIEAYAAEMNIAYSQTANTCVAVFQDKKGRVIVTERWNEELEGEDGEVHLAGWTRLGAFSCDMWRIMAFDRETAMARMEIGGSTNAGEELDAYLASGDTYAENVVIADLEPGGWMIHSGEEFSEEVDRDELDLPEDIHIWCLLARAQD